MSPQVQACIECSAEIAPEQEYCLRCGARQATLPARQWRRALVSAGITTGLAVLALAIGYERMRDDAQTEAPSAARAAPVRPAEASGRGAASDTPKPALSAQLAALPNP